MTFPNSGLYLHLRGTHNSPQIHTTPKNTYGSSNVSVALSRSGRASWYLRSPEGVEQATLCVGSCLTKQ